MQTETGLLSDNYLMRQLASFAMRSRGIAETTRVAQNLAFVTLFRGIAEKTVFCLRKLSLMPVLRF